MRHSSPSQAMGHRREGRVKRVSFKTIGCRLNQAETARMAAQFRAAGYAVVPFGDPCDTCVIHTCAVTARAEKDAVRLARSVKRSAPQTEVILAGCAAEVDGPRLLQQSGADRVAGQQEKFHLAGPSAEVLPLFDTTKAFIKVQDGCEFRCSYCIVPDARGPSVSRPLPEIVAEARALAVAGFREVVLTGANLGCYRDGSHSLVDILVRVEAIPDVERIRLSSVELSTVEKAVIDHMAGSPKLCRYLHIPLQSGDNGILRAMRRTYTAERFRDIIDYAVSALPLVGIGTDVLVGFPGEDEAAFQNTVRLVSDLPFSRLHVFPYSARPGTPAAALPGQVDEKTKKQRARVLIELGRDKTRAFARRCLGRTLSVLVETVRGTTGHGWTGEYLEADVTAPDLQRNQIVSFVPSAFANETLR